MLIFVLKRCIRGMKRITKHDPDTQDVPCNNTRSCKAQFYVLGVSVMLDCRDGCTDSMAFEEDVVMHKKSTSLNGL
jgi:hypothetical protein